MPTPLHARQVLTETALELKLQASRGAVSAPLAAAHHRATEERELQVQVAISILAWGYVSRELLRKHPEIPMTMLQPPAALVALAEHSDAA